MIPTIIEGGVCTGPVAPHEDGVKVDGTGQGVTEIRRRIFDFRDYPRGDQDEVLSGVNGAVVRLYGCVILGGIKAILAGNGNHPGEDMARARWELDSCVIMGAGRRCPEAQDGATVTMRRCWIHDWGQAFDVRAFGAWAHRGGRVIAEDCLFTQSGGLLELGLRNTLADIGNHVGQAVNDHGLRAVLWPSSWRPGVCRGLTADTGGLALSTRCYRNRPWIIVEGCNQWMSREQALDTVLHLEDVCPDVQDRLGGVSLAEMFFAVA